METASPGRSEGVATWLGIGGNVLLCAGKIVVGLLFNSIAIISDSFNSLTDIVASAIVFVSITSSYQAPDPEHPFGHKRAQPIAGLVVAIFTGIVGFEIIAQSFSRLLDGTQIEQGLLPIFLLAAVMVVKLGMYLYARFTARRTRSTALMASAIDHRNDVLVSGAVLLGVAASNLGMPIFDPIVAIAVGLWIIWAGFRIGRANIKYLMGEAPPRELVEKILARARPIHGVLGINDVSAHYVGTTVEIEVHIDVDKALNVAEAHEIAMKVQHAIEGVDEVSRAFIHVEPLEAS